MDQQSRVTKQSLDDYEKCLAIIDCSYFHAMRSNSLLHSFLEPFSVPLIFHKAIFCSCKNLNSIDDVQRNIHVQKLCSIVTW